MLGVRSDADNKEMGRRIRRSVRVVEKVKASFHGKVTGARS